MNFHIFGIQKHLDVYHMNQCLWLFIPLCICFSSGEMWILVDAFLHYSHGFKYCSSSFALQTTNKRFKDR